MTDNAGSAAAVSASDDADNGRTPGELEGPDEETNGPVPAEAPGVAHDDVDQLLAEIAHSRRRWARAVALTLFSLIVVATLITVPAVVAYRFSSGQEPLYEATASVLYDIERAQFGEVDKIMTNAAFVAESRRFLLPEADASVDLDELAERRSVEVVGQGDGTSGSVLVFSVRSDEPDDALAEVEAWVAAFVQDSVVADDDAGQRAELEAVIDDLQDRRRGALNDIDDAEQARAEVDLTGLSTARRSQVVNELDQAVTAAGSRYAEIVNDLNTQARLLEQLEPEGLSIEIESLDDAYVSDDPVSPKPLQALAIGLAIGVLLAGAYLFLVFQVRAQR